MKLCNAQSINTNQVQWNPCVHEKVTRADWLTSYKQALLTRGHSAWSEEWGGYDGF